MNKNRLMKIVVLGLVVVAFAAFFFFGLHEQLTFENLGKIQSGFSGLYQEKPIYVLGVYFAIYVLVTAFSLPGAAVMTLAGGALFDFWPAFITVSFASSIGATLACFFARYVLGNWVQEKFGDKIKPINQGIEKDGAFYLFSLRLVPAFPFFVINLVMGLTKIRIFTFYWVSQLGMLPGTAVYVNAGTQLSTIKSPSDILTPKLIISFVILGLFPLVTKKIMDFILAKRKAGD